MIQNSSRSTSSSSSSSSSCGSAKNAELPAVLNLTLYGSPAPRSVHRTSLGAIRTRPRQKSIKPTTPPPSTPDLHLDLGSLAGSDLEYDSSARIINLSRSDIPGKQDLKHQHSNHASSAASSYHLSNRPSTRFPNHKSCRKTNNKSKVSQMLFHNDEFERNLKLNSRTLKNVTATDRETLHSLPFSKKNQHKQKYKAKKTSAPKSRQISSRICASDQVSEDTSPKIIHTQCKESTEPNLLVSPPQSSTERSNKVSAQSDSSYRADNCFDFSKESNYSQKALSSQTSIYSQSSLQQINVDKTLISENKKKIKDISVYSGAGSCFEETQQDYLPQNNNETSVNHNSIAGFASKEEESTLLEDEYENMATSSYETTVNEVYSKDNLPFKDVELSCLNSQNDLQNYDVCTKDIKVGKTSAHWFIPNDEGKRRYFSKFKYHGNISNTSPEDWERNHTRITETKNSNYFSATENRADCTFTSKLYDHDRGSDELKEEEETLSSSQGSLGRQRKTSDASWSSYHSSTYTTLSDSTWSCSSDTYESFHSEEVCHGKFLFNASDELNSNIPEINPINKPKSEINAKVTSKIVSQKQVNKNLEHTRASSDNERNSGHFQGRTKKRSQPTVSKYINSDSDKGSTSDEICPIKNATCNDGTSQTRQSSSSGITGSITIDSNIDIHHSSPEFPLQEIRSNEKENIHKTFSTNHEAPPEDVAVEEEEEETASTATSEELCLLCSYNVKACRCPQFPNTNNDNNSSISGNNSDEEHNQNLTDSSNSFPSFVRNICSAPERHSEHEIRTKLLLQRLGCCTIAPDVLLSADEVMEAAMYARQLVRVLEQALDRALSIKMTSVSEIASQSNIRRSRSVPEFSSNRPFTYEDHIQIPAEGSSLNTVNIPKHNKPQDPDSNYNKSEANAEIKESFTNHELFSLHNEKQNDQKNDMVKRMNICQEKCYCCGPKLLNVSPQELQRQKALLRPVGKKPQAFTVMKDVASILKNVISHRRDIIVPPEDGAYYVSRSVSEWSIDE